MNPDTAPPATADAQMGAQLTAQYALAVGGIRHVLIFGAMMLQVRDGLISARGNKPLARGVNSDGGLSSWLTEHAPKVNLSTAYRFMDLAEGLRNEFRLAAKTDLVHLLQAPVETLPAPRQKEREKIDAFVEGKSQRQLLFDFGFDTRAGKPKGGHIPRPNSVRRTNDQIAHDQFQSCAETLCLDAKFSIDRALAHRGPAGEFAGVMLTDQDLDALKLAALDLHRACIETQQSRKSSKIA
jgi:hypothetical protein